MVQTLQEVDAHELLEPYLLQFQQCYDEALQQLNQIILTYPHLNHARTRATMMHNLVVSLIKERLSNDAAVHIITKYESITVVIGNSVYGRFKKINRRGISSNIRTRRNEAILQQQLEIPFANVPAAANVDIGYVIDPMWTEFDDLRVVCRRGGNVLWEFSFVEVAQPRTNTVPIAEVPVPQKPRFIIKKNNEDNIKKAN